MKVERTVYLKFEDLGIKSGVLTLTDASGQELESRTVCLDHKAGVADVALYLLKRAEYLYG